MYLIFSTDIREPKHSGFHLAHIELMTHEDPISKKRVPTGDVSPNSSIKATTTWEILAPGGERKGPVRLKLKGNSIQTYVFQESIKLLNKLGVEPKTISLELADYNVRRYRQKFKEIASQQTGDFDRERVKLEALLSIPLFAQAAILYDYTVDVNYTDAQRTIPGFVRVVAKRKT